MTLRRQLLRIALWSLTIALGLWGDYCWGLKQGRAASLTPRTKIEIENQGMITWRGEWRKDFDYKINDAVMDKDHKITYLAVKPSRNVPPDPAKSEPWVRMTPPDPPAPPPERTDANWRGN